MLEMPDCVFVINTISHDIPTTATVLIAVARVESTFSIPTFARIDVSAANTAESNANNHHIYITSPYIL